QIRTVNADRRPFPNRVAIVAINGPCDITKVEILPNVIQKEVDGRGRDRCRELAVRRSESNGQLLRKRRGQFPLQQLGQRLVQFVNHDFVQLLSRVLPIPTSYPETSFTTSGSPGRARYRSNATGIAA